MHKNVQFRLLFMFMEADMLFHFKTINKKMQLKSYWHLICVWMWRDGVEVHTVIQRRFQVLLNSRTFKWIKRVYVTFDWNWWTLEFILRHNNSYSHV